MEAVVSDTERRAIEEVLKGFAIHQLADGWTPLEALVLVKCLDDEGEATWSYRTTSGLNLEELLGAMVVHAELLKKRLVAEFEGDDDIG